MDLQLRQNRKINKPLNKSASVVVDSPEKGVALVILLLLYTNLEDVVIFVREDASLSLFNGEVGSGVNWMTIEQSIVNKDDERDD
ncbi:hypothetical protein QVD17_19858 [Tagetes erecta]|uniref:Uncharacterized protein n=1 Tax=Tagetes erecta TaxID=13708 RepID=A0AAD8KKL0_TARER|nr:hypothetical protein QVD17_19858 [Tagetes erecta]